MDKNKCNSCGEAPHKCSCKNKDFTKSVIEIDNPEQITLMRKVVIPTSMGDDTTVPPVVGKYHNVLLYYEANSKSYLYSSDGIPTQLVNGVTDYEQAVNLPQINGNTLIGDKTGDQLGLQNKLTAGENITIEDDVISATDTTYGPATDTEIGLVKPGDGLEVDASGTMSISNVEQYAHFFDTVADMKSAANLADGDYARTLGYYSKDDIGGAYYRISNVAPSGYYETLASGLYAELLIEDTMNVKQFGCKGDDSNNDTTKFNVALDNCKKIFVPSGTYRIDRFLPKSNQEIVGIGRPVIKLVGTLAPLCELSSNLKLENLHIVSENENLEWDRCNISNKEDITISSCVIEGFRHDSQAPNAWGILIGNSNRISINSCYFDNNSQSDIAMVNGCENISISNCSGSSFFINIEPNDLSAPNDAISISNCKLARLNILENNFNGTGTNSTTISSCTIGILKYDGGGATFVSCSIDDFANEINSGVIYGGTVKFIDSGNFTKNLLSDPYIDNYVNNTSATNPWTTRYTPLALADSFTRIKDENGLQFVLNPNNASTSVSIKSEHIAINPNKKYLIRIAGKTKNPTGSNYKSLHCRVKWFDAQDNEISTQIISIFRTSNVESPFSEQSAILVPPEDTDYAVLWFVNASDPNQGVTGTQSLFVRSVELFGINQSNIPNNMNSLPIREHREFYCDTMPGLNFANYHSGDKTYYTDPTVSGYIGAVCVADGTPGNAGTWDNYGALAS